MNNIEKELKILKDYFRNKAASGSVLLNDEDVLLAFEKVVKNIENKACKLQVPLL